MIRLNPKYLKAKKIYPYKRYGKILYSFKIFSTIENCVLNGSHQPFIYQIEDSIKYFFLIDNFFKIENDLENNNLSNLDFNINAIFLTNQFEDLYSNLNRFKRRNFKMNLFFKKKILKINLFNNNGTEIVKTHIGLSPEYEKLDSILELQGLPKDLILR